VTAAEESVKPRRISGSWVILVRGRPVLYVSAAGRQLLTFPSMISAEHAELVSAFRALHGLPRLGRRLLVVEKIDGIPVEESPHYELIRSCGFARDYRGLISAAAS
jgi:ATP-dependent Lhr-like helicase